MIEGVVITPLKRIADERGTVMHMMKSRDEGFNGFGEIYGSTIFPGVVKAWKCHNIIQTNYVVVSGMIKFVLYDDREESSTKGQVQEIFVGEDNYVRVTVPPKVWNGFKGVGVKTALVVNIINESHDPSQVTKVDPHQNKIPYEWLRKDG